MNIDLKDIRFDYESAIHSTNANQRDEAFERLYEAACVLQSQVENADASLEQLRMSLTSKHQKELAEAKQKGADEYKLSRAIGSIGL